MEQNSQQQATPSAATPNPAASQSATASPSVMGFLDEHKTFIASGLVAVATYFFPPAKLVLQADPQLAMIAVSALFAGLHALAKGPGILRK